MTHTAEPVAAPSGQGYRCTEFVFHLDPALLSRPDIAGIDHAVGRWLVRTR